MYQITVTTNGTPEKIDVPQSWSELDWLAYVNAVGANSDVATLSALTGISVEGIKAMIPEHQQFLFTQCAFFWNDELMMQELPATFIEIQIAQGTWQQLVDSEQEFKRVEGLELPQIEAAQMIIQTYAKVGIKGMKVPEAMGYWSFFFFNLVSGRSNGLDSMTTNLMIMKLLQELKSSKSLDSFKPFIQSAMVTHSNTRTHSESKPTSFTQPYCSKRRSTITKKNLEKMQKQLHPKLN